MNFNLSAYISSLAENIEQNNQSAAKTVKIMPLSQIMSGKKAGLVNHTDRELTLLQKEIQLLEEAKSTLSLGDRQLNELTEQDFQLMSEKLAYVLGSETPVNADNHAMVVKALEMGILDKFKSMTDTVKKGLQSVFNKAGYRQSMLKDLEAIGKTVGANKSESEKIAGKPLLSVDGVTSAKSIISVFKGIGNLLNIANNADGLTNRMNDTQHDIYAELAKLIPGAKQVKIGADPVFMYPLASKSTAYLIEDRSQNSFALKYNQTEISNENLSGAELASICNSAVQLYAVNAKGLKSTISKMDDKFIKMIGEIESNGGNDTHRLSHNLYSQYSQLYMFFTKTFKLLEDAVDSLISLGKESMKGMSKVATESLDVDMAKKSKSEKDEEEEESDDDKKDKDKDDKDGKDKDDKDSDDDDKESKDKKAKNAKKTKNEGDDDSDTDWDDEPEDEDLDDEDEDEVVVESIDTTFDAESETEQAKLAVLAEMAKKAKCEDDEEKDEDDKKSDEDEKEEEEDEDEKESDDDKASDKKSKK